MKMNWRRALVLLLLLCSLVALMGVGALAAGSEDAAQTETEITGDAAGDGAGATDGDAAGDGANSPSATVALRFYDRNGDLIASATVESHTAGTAITAAEIASLESHGVTHWLYGTSKDALTGCAAADLTTLTPQSDLAFYAAYYVTYKDAGGNTLGGEYVLPNATPTKAPASLTGGAAITGWKDAGGKTVAFTGDAAVKITDNITFTAVVDTAALSTVTFYDYDGTELGKVENMAAGSKLAMSQIPESKGAAVDCWVLYSGGERVECTPAELTAYPINTDAAVYAAWRVTYLDSDGKTTLRTEIVRGSETPSNVPTLNGANKSIVGWLDASGKSVTPATQKPTANTTYTAWVRPSLSTGATIAYISGSAEADGTIYRFNPNGTLTRAEAAKMIYNLLSEADRAGGPLEVSFSDVSDRSWYATAVNALASHGILNGTGAGKFEPNTAITRAQFVTMVSRLFPTQSLSGASPFKDVTNPNTSYYSAVMTAYMSGWITGYQKTDGYYFYPQNAITRAEAVKILSGVLGRNAESDSAKAKIDALGCGIFVDIESNWAYYWIMDAATGGGTSVPSTKLSTGRHKIDGSYYFVDSNGHFAYQTRGVHKMLDGKYYFFKKAGIAAPVYSAGPRKLGDDAYMLASDGSIVYDKMSGYDTRVYEYQGYLYYIQEDGTLLQGEYFGPLYFCKNGYYTSGYSDLDSWVYGFLADILKSSKGQEEKLREAYEKMRDLPKERYGDGGLGYGTRGETIGMTYEQVACSWFKNARGDCSAWASAFVQVARRVGYKAWIAEGKISLGGPHAWEVIEIGGTKYTFDIEQEWGYLYRYYSNSVRYYDCWKMEYKPGQAIQYGSRYSNSIKNIWSPYTYSEVIGL